MADVELIRRTAMDYASQFPGKSRNDVVACITKYVGDDREIILPEILQRLSDNGTTPILGRHLHPEVRDQRNLAFSISLNEYRIALMAFSGWRDASVRLGHLVC